jgi:hypothetical protein
MLSFGGFIGVRLPRMRPLGLNLLFSASLSILLSI